MRCGRVRIRTRESWLPVRLLVLRAAITTAQPMISGRVRPWPALRSKAMAELSDEVLAVLRSKMSRGQLALFTGAGFSRSALAVDGQPVPGAEELRKSLWQIAFPAEPVDEKSTLADVFACALEQSPTRVDDLFQKCLRISNEQLPNSLSRLVFRTVGEAVYAQCR